MVSVDKMFIFSKGLVSKLLPPPLWTSDRTQLSSHVVRLRQTESVFCFKLWSDFPLGYWTGRTRATDQCTLSTDRFISKHVGWNRSQDNAFPPNRGLYISMGHIFMLLLFYLIQMKIKLYLKYVFILLLCKNVFLNPLIHLCCPLAVFYNNIN